MGRPDGQVAEFLLACQYEWSVKGYRVIWLAPERASVVPSLVWMWWRHPEDDLWVKWSDGEGRERPPT